MTLKYEPEPQAETRVRAERFTRLIQASAGNGDLNTIVDTLGLGRAAGPTPLPRPSPPEEARHHAIELALKSLPALERAITSNGLKRFGPYEIQPPTELRLLAVRHGLPFLLSAYSEDDVAKIAMKRAGLAHPKLSPFHRELAHNLSALLLYEHMLWDLASANGGPTTGMPWAFRYRALEWWWTPTAHGGDKAQDAFALCLRCGELLQRDRSFNGHPLCTHCMNESPARRAWPSHAIAPAGRGTWWLTCQHPDCDTVFRAQRQARKCEVHKTNRTTLSRRQTATPAPMTHDTS